MQKNCPADILLNENGEDMGECFQCQKCTCNCPKKNVTTGISKLHGNEIWFTLLRRVLLFTALKLIGV